MSRGIKILLRVEIAVVIYKNSDLTDEWKAAVPEHNKAYRFFKNLYEYEEREAVLVGKSKFDKETNQRLNGNQHLFRRPDNTYFCRTNEKQIGSVAQPLHLKKNFRLTTNLNPLNLTKLARKTLCQKAEFSKIPLEAEQVPKESGQCNKSLANHFQTKSVLNFTFTPENAELAQQFFNQLDDYAEEYEATEAKDFLNPRISDPIGSQKAQKVMTELNNRIAELEQKLNRVNLREEARRKNREKREREQERREREINELATKFYQANSIKVLASFKEYTELKKDTAKGKVKKGESWNAFEPKQQLRLI
ncbi:16697_t:CDS:2, partial [Gigaspora margarita]